jgi:uncharacterized membrane protein
MLMLILVAGLILFLGVHLLPILPGPRIGTVAALAVMALHRILFGVAVVPWCGRGAMRRRRRCNLV